MSTQAETSVPAHVPANLIIDFDPYTDTEMKHDLHNRLAALQRQFPPVFFTPRNQGHWVVTRYELMAKVLRDTEHFSAVQVQVPLTKDPWTLIPLNLDPPRHTVYRLVLMKYFSATALQRWDSEIRTQAAEMVRELAPVGHCDFAEGIALKFPVSIFMKLVGWPFERMDEFRSLAVSFFTSLTDPAKSVQRFAAIREQVHDLLAHRMANRGDDLFSKLMDERIESRTLTMEELESIGCLLFLAGLDSVASTATYVFLFLARNPQWQDTLRADPAMVEPFIEEAMRQFGIVNIVRVTRREVQIGDAILRPGEPVMCLLPMAGLDPAKNPDPEKFLLERPGRQHLIFGGGVHTCLGNGLARRELRILVQEWLAAIHGFELQPGFRPQYRLGQQTSLEHLLLQWNAEGQPIRH